MQKETSKKGLNIFRIKKSSNLDKLSLNYLWKGDELPFGLKSSLAFIFVYHLKTINVFRRNGNEIVHESLCNSLKKAMNTQPPLSISMVFDVCSALKAYLRDIPNGLMAKKLQKEWHKIARITDEENMKKKIKNIIQKLPDANRNLLFYFLVLISAIIENEKENAMCKKSLSIVFLPSIFEKVVNITDIKDLPYFMRLFEVIIVNADYLMEHDTFKKIEADLKDIGQNLVIQSPSVGEDNSVEAKADCFVSQDSGLNLTSYFDDKSSHGNSTDGLLSYQNNSMDDLLTESVISDATVATDINILDDADSIISESSLVSSDDHDGVQIEAKLFNKRNSQCNSTLKFKKIYINQKFQSNCRPHSLYDPPGSVHHKPDFIQQKIRCYKSLCNDCSLRMCEESFRKDEINSDKKLFYLINRRKSNVKRLSSVLVTFGSKRNICYSSNSTVTSRPQSMILDQCSNNELSYWSANVNKTKIIIKNKSKRNLKFCKTRYTVPIRLTGTEMQDLVSFNLSRSAKCIKQ